MIIFTKDKLKGFVREKACEYNELYAYVLQHDDKVDRSLILDYKHFITINKITFGITSFNITIDGKEIGWLMRDAQATAFFNLAINELKGYILEV